jgi:hypothetical protein
MLQVRNFVIVSPFKHKVAFRLGHTKSSGLVLDATRVIIYILFALVTGSFAVIQMTNILVVITSFVGGYMLTGSVDHFGLKWRWWTTPSLDPFSGFLQPQVTEFECRDASCWVLVSCWMFLFVAGVLVQCRCCKPDSARYERENCLDDESVEVVVVRPMSRGRSRRDDYGNYRALSDPTRHY